MRKLFIILSAPLLLAGCAKNQKQIESVQNRLMTVNKLSPLELKSYEFKVQEISDREACLQIMDIYGGQIDYQPSQDSFYVYANKVEKMYGTEIYYKVEIIDKANLESGSRTFYLDNHNKFLIAK